MKILKAVAFSVVASVVISACGQKTSNNNTDAQTVGIVGGTPVSVSDVAAGHVVGLVFILPAQPGQPAGSHGMGLCTGTLVTKDIVLTAAHCADLDYEQAFVVFQTSIEKPDPKLLRKVIAKSVNSAWQPTQLNKLDIGDTALLKFSGPLAVGYSPAELLTDSSALQVGTSILEMGYGMSTPGQEDDGAGVLRKGTVKILNNTAAKTEIVTDERDGQGVCEGDSGGPAFVQVGGKYLLWGVASRVAGTPPDPAHPDQPPVVLCNQYAIETNIVPWTAWLNTQIQSLEATPAIMASTEN